MNECVMQLNCSAVLFDLDGVLVDSIHVVERSWHNWAIRNGLDPSHVLDYCHGRPTADTIANLKPELDAQSEASCLELAQAQDASGLVACRGAASLLCSLRPDQWAVVTSGTRPLALSRLRAVGLPNPRVLIAADDGPRGKPSPDGYLAAAARLNVAPDACVVVEDAYHGVIAARAAGAMVIAIQGRLLGDAPEVDMVVKSLEDLGVVVFDGTIRIARLQ